MKNRRVSFKTPLAALGTVALGLGLALVPAAGASAATGELSVRNNCGYDLEYYVIGAGNDYAFAGQTRNWTLDAGWYTVSSSGGAKQVYVAANRGYSVGLC